MIQVRVVWLVIPCTVPNYEEEEKKEEDNEDG